MSTTCEPADRLMQSLLVHVPGATEDVLKLELFNVIDEFFKRSMAWRYLIEVTLEPGIIEYSYGLPGNAHLIRVIGATHNGQPMVAAASQVTQRSLGSLAPELTFPDGDAMFSPDVIDLTPSELFTYAIYRPDYIYVTAVGDDQAKFPLQLTAALTVTRGCLECDCGDWPFDPWMWDTYFQDWYDGVLGRMYAMPAKPWSSDKHASFHGKKFRNHMAFRKQESKRGFVYGVPTWRFPRS
jgi:hypothetical protein